MIRQEIVDPLPRHRWGEPAQYAEHRFVGSELAPWFADAHLSVQAARDGADRPILAGKA